MTLMSFEGRTKMTTSTATERRELAQRSSYAIEVTLFWTESTNLVTIEVIDPHSADGLEFEVDGSAALDAFNHPFAYAATRRVRRAQARPAWRDLVVWPIAAPEHHPSAGMNANPLTVRIDLDHPELAG
jgi:hypothetical protein